ncbi:hydroxymethylbilane synthase [Lutimonas saemankumensis]|uniref:hydroxymethylbilane synthase n=1 Tax=Lutimonas saemankumensis TaxID=483016 RepID=UPI001CD55E6F|nr:hydroxymethylbilane synthase [Lutimonas saemankumensis]MCA0931179.1 hydroxymethylbilane synthase [Lutimonas saemankumensis]
MKKVIRIGTRSSELALWQANTVSNQLRHLGHETKIVKIDSIGDEVLNKPLYELGTTGVFTKNLDIALLNNKIDIAVHSLKDVPTVLPKGIVQAAVLKRGLFQDILVLKDNDEFFTQKSAIIATGSLRRKAQWLYRYPNHTITDLRGNVNTRLKKLHDNEWNGAIFALAGLKRIGILPENTIKLDWMIPAPAQGAVMVAALDQDEELLKALYELNDKETEICVGVERDFLNKLEGGCTAPIGALATIKNEELNFKGALFSTDGKKKIEFTKSVPLHRVNDLSEFAASYILDRGGKKLMRKLGKVEKRINIFSTKNLSIGQKSALNPEIGVDMSDFITIRHNRIKPVTVKQPIEHVIFTSQNGVEALLDNFMASELQFEKIYCVGRRTKRLIERKIGKVSHVENSAGQLGKYLSKNLKDVEVTFFCGDKRRDELPAILEENGIILNEVIAYQTLLSPNRMNKEYDGLLFFSPSAIESYLSKNEPKNETAFCIGGTTAKAAQNHFKQVVEAKMPSVESVLKSVNTHFIK